MPSNIFILTSWASLQAAMPVTGAATVIIAMGAGIAASKGIHEYLANK